jgi:glutamate carboxypeptidase
MTLTWSGRTVIRVAASALALYGSPLAAQQLSGTETSLRARVEALGDSQIAFLAQSVNLPSGTFNPAGVRKVGSQLRAELDALGFTTRWVELPPEMKRGGHLVADRPARRRIAGGKRMLLIGHFDTVFEGEGQRFERADSIAKGAGTADMKGGNAIMLFALKALHAEGLLDRMTVSVVVTGDEEDPGRPLDQARKALIDAARTADVALSFEGGQPRFASITRRGTAGWTLSVTGRQAHSAGVFSEGTGYGSIYEAARILDGFRVALAGEPGLTFNPGVIGGGTDVSIDSSGTSVTASGKTNIVSRRTEVRGDLRFVTDEQRLRAMGRMREIVQQSLPGTSAAIVFEDGYPAMPETAAGRALLAQYDSVSRALGYPPVEALDAIRRGAGDLSFVAPYVAGMDGLGAIGGGSHSPEEWVNLRSLEMQTARATILMARLAGIRR